MGAPMPMGRLRTSCGQWLSAEGAADVAGASRKGAAVADLRSRCGRDAEAIRDQPGAVDADR